MPVDAQNLINRATQIRDAFLPEENTAFRVGSLLYDMVQTFASTVGQSFTHPLDGANVTLPDASGKFLSSITVNEMGHVLSVSARRLLASDIPTLEISKIKDLSDSLSNKLDKDYFEKLFYPVYKEDGSIAYIRTPYTLLSDGDVQSKKFSEVEGGGSAVMELLTEWSDYTVADKDWLGLSAGLGYELHNRLTLLENQGGVGFDPSLLEDYATRDWVNEQGFVKASDLTVYATRNWVSEQGFLTEHQSLDDYLTKTLASQTYLGIDATAKAANKFANNAAFTAWGQTFFENGVPKSVSGTLTGVADIRMNGLLYVKKDAHDTGFYIETNANKGFGICEYGSSGWLRTAMVITATNNYVGIGTTSPAYKLDVNGTARVTQLKVGKFTFTDKGDYLEFDGTILALGDVQSKKYGDIAGGGSGGGDFSIMSSWDASLASDPDFVLSAGLGYDLYLNKLSKSEAEGLYQPKGNYALASALGDYVTKNTAQEITGAKTFGNNVIISNGYGIGLSNSIPKIVRTNGCWIHGGADGLSETDANLRFGSWYSIGWYNTCAAGQSGSFAQGDNAMWLNVCNGHLYVQGGYHIKGGTSAQFLKADGSVDNNTYLTSHQALDYINVKDIRGTAPAPTAMASKKVTAWFNNTDKPGSKTWYSGLTVQGWNSHENYAGWQLAASADVNLDDQNLYFRVGAGTTWKAWQKVLTDANFSSVLDNSYVKKSGDTMTGVLTIKTDTQPCLKLDSYTANKEVYAYFYSGGVAKACVGWSPASATGAYLYNSTCQKTIGVRDDGTPNFAGNTLWHSGNDGAGSGLDADLLDGYHETSFLRYRGDIPTAYVDITNYSSGAAEYTNYHPGIFNIARSGYSELLINLARNGGSTSALQFKTSYADNAPLYFRKTIDSNRVSGQWRTILTELNIGSYNAGSATKLQTARNFSIADYYSDHTGAAAGFDGTAAVTLKLPEDVNVRNLIGKGSVTAKNGLIAADDTYGGLYAYGGSSSYRARIWARRLTGSWGTDDIWVDVDSNGKSIFYHPVEIRGDVVVKGTIFATGDVQSKKAAQAIGEVVEIDRPKSGSTVKIPSTASVVILRTDTDGGEITLEIDGDINDFNIINIYTREFSAGDTTIKFKTSSYYTSQYTVTLAHLALVRYNNSVYLEKYS